MSCGDETPQSTAERGKVADKRRGPRRLRLADVTGDSSASKGIIFVGDIFGYFEQSLQGADILAHDGKYMVFFPDFFDGKPCPIEM